MAKPTQIDELTRLLGQNQPQIDRKQPPNPEAVVPGVQTRQEAIPSPEPDCLGLPEEERISEPPRASEKVSVSEPAVATKTPPTPPQNPPKAPTPPKSAITPIPPLEIPERILRRPGKRGRPPKSSKTPNRKSATLIRAADKSSATLIRDADKSSATLTRAADGLPQSALVREERVGKHADVIDYANRRAIKQSNIGPMPPIRDPDRRDACENDLTLFLETYFPEAFPLNWSDDHLEVIHKTQQALVNGGFFAIAMPRGSGKTTITIRAALWAILYGKSSFVFIVAADATKAKNMLRSIKIEIEYNPLLFEDFPEAAHPIRCLQGATQGAKKQHLDGHPTDVDWTADCAQLATLPGSKCSGARIGVGGITGAARGAQITLTDGRVMRPSLVLIDDFQTRESSASEMQCKTRLSVLTGDVGGLRPPGGNLAILATMTVIHQGDAADQLLNRSVYPEWHGTRKKMVLSWPERADLWEDYTELRRKAFAKDEEPVAATKFYGENRDEMDRGGEVSWPDRKTRDNLSALQHAYDLLCDQGEEAFAAEYQNEPLKLEDSRFGFLTLDGISEKLNRLTRGDLPGVVTKITAAIDIQQDSLWYCIVAWGEGFSGWIADYGTFPDQQRRFYSKHELPFTLGRMYSTLNVEQGIYKGLEVLVAELLGRRWKLGDGSVHAIDRLLIDEGFKPDTVHLFCRQHGQGNIVMPCKGFGLKAGRQPMNEWPKQKGERSGVNWRIRPTVQDRTIRHVLIDANYWKTFVHQRLAAQFGGDGCLSLWGNKPLEHRLFAGHLTSETPTRTEGHGRELVEWELRPTRPDNEWFDCLAYCCCGAAEQGISLIGEGPPASRRRRPSGRMSLAEKRAQKRASNASS